MATKMGMKRTTPQPSLKRKTPLRANKGLNTMSNTRRDRLVVLRDLITKLRAYSHNKSELSGNEPNWQSSWLVEPHHIIGRNGNKLLDPFNIILLTRDEHLVEQSNMSFERKNELLELIKPIRKQQGFIKTIE